ncbi:MAG TPA: GTP diphosphokinase [Coxiellaceae bacterium]|nr:GTP diphosphokinase [Coxiellaceae bacterium]
MENLTPNTWLQKIHAEFPPADYETIKQAVLLAKLAGENNSAITDHSFLNQSLATAEILHQLNLDSTTIAAAILYGSVQYGGLTIEDITEHLGPQVAKLIHGIQQMAGISEFYQVISSGSNYHHNINNIKKMFLAMVDDIRVVLIKLAEHLCVLRSASILPEKIKKQLAAETMAIYAPLANRLGISQIKWELEDLAFLYLEPEKYQKIALTLEQRFPECNQYIKEAIASLQTLLSKTQIKDILITGRAKHIYSIYRKMERKKVGLEGIYDVSAIRIFVPTIADCYTVLSHVHAAWQYIPNEFDDYIVAPKSNRYRSIHTAVYGPKNRIIEIQIRTHNMHRETELGIAAHWVYKEGKQEANYSAKLAWLRQLIDWQQEVAQSEKKLLDIQQIFNEHVYVFTTQSDILELPKGATPVDFAYRVHSELGHHCCGAKINNNMVPLTYILKTGDRVEILTSRDASPSRDWLIPSLGYLSTSHARSKVLHWFKKQSQEYNIIQGQELLNKEIQRLGLNKIDLKIAVNKLNFKTSDDLLAALGGGSLKLSGILNSLNIELEKPASEITTEIVPTKLTKKNYTSDINIQGVGNLLVHTANCCKPIPGEEIIGYITQGRGISIHRTDCINALHIKKLYSERFITVAWGKNTEKKYPVDIDIIAFDRQELVRDITNILADEKIAVTGLELVTNKKENTAKIKMTIEISGINPLSSILNKISKLPNIIEIYRTDLRST